MSVREADARLLSPTPVRRVALLGRLEGWRSALESVEIEVVAEDADLVVAEPRFAGRAVELAPPTLILLGPRRRALRRAGYATRTVIIRPGRDGSTRLFVPVDAPAAFRSALLAPMPGRSFLKRLATRALGTALRIGIPIGPAITVGTRLDRPPMLLAEAANLGLDLGRDWSLLAGEGDDLQRLVWFCFGTDGKAEWAVKCSRIPRNDAPFRREQTAFHTLDHVPAQLRRHAPTFRGLLNADCVPALIETAAPGRPLQEVLGRLAHDPAVALIDRVADWIVELGRATRLPPSSLEHELERLDQQVVPAWTSTRALNGLVASIPPLPGVLQHNDLGCWNILCDGEMFTAVDWESSRRAGLPLWDLVYFLCDAFATLTAPADTAAKERAIFGLLRGESPDSAALFDRVRATAGAFGMPLDAVGPVATLAWMHHGLSAAARSREGARYGATTGSRASVGPLERIARPWLLDEQLGPSWPAFVRAERP